MSEKISFEKYKAWVANVDTFNDCPVQAVIRMLSGKWSMAVLFTLIKEDNIRFGRLKEKIGGITNTMLSATLKELEANGLLVRTQFNEIPPHVEYALSDKGRRLYPIFLEMGNFTSTNL